MTNSWPIYVSTSLWANVCILIKVVNVHMKREEWASASVEKFSCDSKENPLASPFALEDGHCACRSLCIKS